ncbi:uncharacterized protein KY384_004909 [Bacidia gigantensis]|uniref:uncharacterized protein n=1 Tax=Bacidia gigantensis TaxID=2732470 RepID=UPI001D03C9B1|nr:uncharacterized protein KY384_004909 [Bacidia gigantensis]KAG8530407.1 hypothetical protein KY384_004909 [Bacidia gigantensis]
MPLRAKIINPSFSTHSSKKITIEDGPMIDKQVPGESPSDVLFNTHYGVRTIELNRPGKMNSLNASMAQKIISRLLEWTKSDLANIILISGAAVRGSPTGKKPFCAGGDVAALAELNIKGPEGQRQSHDYFALEYQLDHLIATYPKPYIAYMDGITMGGGVGLSVHAPIRIATERTIFAMPETNIGFFPDVGGSFFLSRLEGSIGAYLALTSKHLRGVDVYFAGIATHYIDSSTLPNLTARLAELQFKDFDSLDTRLEIINATIAEFDTGLPFERYGMFVSELRRAVDRCFSQGSVEEIIAAVRKEIRRGVPRVVRTWADDTLQALSERSPTSLRVALRLQQLGKDWSIAETFQREYELAGKFMAHPDFTQGVSARLIRKPAAKPVWEPPTLQEVSEQRIEEMLQPQEGGKKLELFNTGDYRSYPHSLALPRDEEVAVLVKSGSMSKEALISHLLGKYNHKLGLREKVNEILKRCCSDSPNTGLRWREEQ